MVCILFYILFLIICLCIVIGRKEGNIDDSNIATCLVLKPFAHDELKHSNDNYYEKSSSSSSILTSSNTIGIYNRGAIVCLVCGGFLCPYNVINNDGSWKCIFCNSINPAFHLSTSLLFLKEKYKELENPHVNYITTCRFNDSNSTHDKYPIHLYAIDSILCNDNNVMTLILESLVSLSNIDGENIRVSIVICGNRSLSLLRLFGITNNSNDSNTVTADVLSSLTDQSYQINRLLVQGIYTTAVGILISKFDVIKAYISSIGQNDSIKGCPTIETVVGLCTSMADIMKGPGVRLQLICSRVFPISKSTEVIVDDGTVLGLSKPKIHSTSTDTAVVYSQLGKYAVSKGCYIDVIHANILGTPKFDLLDALSGATGGILVVAESYADETLRRNFMKSIIEGVTNNKNSFGNHLQKGTVATLEVRTCDKIKVDRFVGPILTGTECIENFFTNQDDSISTSSLTISDDHINFTVDNALDSVDSNTDYKIPLLNITRKKVAKMNGNRDSFKEDAQRSILSTNDNQILCGLCRYNLNAHLSLQLKSRVKSADEDTETCAQIVIRYKSADGFSNIVRVWTVSFKLTNLLSKFIDVMNERLWSTVTAQIITADYHDNCIDAFGGASNSTLASNSDEPYLRKRSLKNIENLLKTITSIFFKETDRFHPKLDTIFRFFYHLSEGIPFISFKLLLTSL